jgi:hypothetical protein
MSPIRAENRSRYPDDEQRRWDIAIDIVLNSGLFAPYVDDFWRFVDGEDPEGEFRRSIT